MTHRPGTLVTLLRAPLAIAAMLLDLASNAAAQAPTGIALSVDPAAVTESSAAFTNSRFMVSFTPIFNDIAVWAIWRENKRYRKPAPL